MLLPFFILDILLIHNYNSKNTIFSKVTLKDPHILVLLSTYSSEFVLECERNKNKNYFQINVDRFWNGRMQIVALYDTRSAVASVKSLYRVEMSVGSLRYARDLLRVERENQLLLFTIIHAWQLAIQKIFSPENQMPSYIVHLYFLFTKYFWSLL